MGEEGQTPLIERYMQGRVTAVHFSSSNPPWPHVGAILTTETLGSTRIEYKLLVAFSQKGAIGSKTLSEEGVVFN